MKTIALASQKGGAGKSTISVHLAIEALASKKGAAVLMLDMDPQGSLLEWRRQREDEDPVVLPATAAELPELLKQAADDGFDYVFIDTPGRLDDAIIAAASAAADLVLLPVRTSLFDLRAVGQTADLIMRSGTPARFVISQAPVRGAKADDTAAVCESLYPSIAVARSRIAARAAFENALVAGSGVQELDRPGSKAREEISALFKEVSGVLRRKR